MDFGNFDGIIGVDIPTNTYLEAEIREVIRIAPFNEEDKDPCLAISYLIQDKNTNNYFSWAERVVLKLKNKGKIFNLLTAITGRVIGPEFIKKSGSKIDTDKLLYKHISLYFQFNSYGNLQVRSYTRIDKSKWNTDMRSNPHYKTPEWINANVYDPSLLPAEGSLDDLLDGNIDTTMVFPDPSPESVIDVDIVNQSARENNTENMDIDIQ